jgi:spore coat polysaccharide biosynthesis protein SpsF
MKIAITLTVRMKSKRLPRKAILKIKGKTIIEHLIDRVKLAKIPDMIVLCTSTHPDDEILCKIAERNNILFFRGSENDKLYRYLYAARKFGFDYMIDVSGDNIFPSIEYIDLFANAFKNYEYDAIICKGLPLGCTPVGLKIKAIEKICEMKSEEDTEAYLPYFFESKIFNVKCFYAKPELNRPDIRLTIDYKEDYELIKKIFEMLNMEKNKIPLRRIIELFERHPELKEINKEAQKKYEENFKKLPQPKVKQEYANYFTKV